MQLRLQFQQNEVADEVAAVTAVVRPILEGLLYGLKREVAADAGGYQAIRLRSLPRLYRAGDRDCGICFEYAVHDALNRREPTVLERVHHAVRMCNVPGNEPSSILFGLEKTGALNLVDTAMGRLTDESRLLAGNRGQPAKLKRHIDSIASAFRRTAARNALPESISGIWKADLFVGYTDSDRWIGTTVKINPAQLEGARGLRVGIVPARGGRDDLILRDDARNLIVCPLPHDHSFMQVFYQGWGVVQQFVAADAQIPREVALPNPVDRQVARYLFERREHPVVDVLEALVPLSQPELLRTEEQNPVLVSRREEAHDVETGAVVAPLPRAVAVDRH
ncbi:MAG: hypothetical protein KIT17_23995 [Rubrivivax sp.]|nr:hypothetical protein [Rubrivivax sp.]